MTKIQGRAASAKRATPSPSGETSRRPIAMMAKLTPQIATTERASARSRTVTVVGPRPSVGVLQKHRLDGAAPARVVGLQHLLGAGRAARDDLFQRRQEVGL